MTEKNLLTSLKGRFAPVAKNGMWMAGGIAIALAVTVAAQQSASTDTPIPCDLGAAAQAAMNDRIKLIASTSSDPSKYFNQNCLGDFSFASLDLSVMIPDPMGLLTDAALKAADKLKNAAINKVCAAARNSLNDTIGRYNEVINTTNTIGNGFGGAVTNLIDNSIAGQAQSISDKYNLNYNSSSSVATLPTTSSAASNATNVATPTSAAASQAAQDSASLGSSILSGR